MITNIKTSGFRGHDIDITLDRLTLLTGPNGAGKTSAISAAELTFRGHITGQDKTAQALFLNASGPQMTTEGVIDGHKVRISLQRGKGDRVSASAFFDGTPTKDVQSMLMASLGAGVRVFDGSAFFGLSDRLQRIAILKVVCDEQTAQDVLDGEVADRKTLNDFRQRRQTAEEVLTGLSRNLTNLPPQTGNANQIDEEIGKAEALLKDLRDQISRGEENARERKRLQAIVDNKEANARRIIEIKESIDEQKRLAKEAAKALKDAEKGIAEMSGKKDPDAAVVLPIEAESRIKSAIICLTTVVHGIELNDTDSIVPAELTEAIDLLTPLVVDREERERQGKAIQVLANAFGQAKTDEKKATSAIPALERTAGELKAKIAEADKATKLLAKQGAEVSEETRTAAIGTETRIKELRTRRDGMTERETIERQMEGARIAAEKAKDAEEEAKKKIEAHLKKQQETLSKSLETVKADANRILPYGSLEFQDAGARMAIGWEMPDGFVERSALSGFERTVFDGAVARALAGPNATIFIDAGECSNTNLYLVQEHIRDADKGQVVIARWTDDEVRLKNVEGWTTIEMGAR